ncbi:MAG: DUF2304 domain-containing protein [Bacilli bacterium]|jgi:hypothetical protein|nr:DUF2304 domain-containing protein [Bacilli bacterium]
MNFQLQLVFIFASIATLIYVIRKIRKHKLNIDDSIIWIIWAIFLLVISVFPSLCHSISKTLGFQSTSNFILTLFTFFLYIILFFQNIQISLLKEKNKELTQKMSIYAYEKEQEDK